MWMLEEKRFCITSRAEIKSGESLVLKTEILGLLRCAPKHLFLITRHWRETKVQNQRFMVTAARGFLET
jgi:hypothetical protein